MCKRILSASVSMLGGKSAVKIQPSPQINILCGERAEDVVFALAGIWSTPGRNRVNRHSAAVKAEIHWSGDVTFLVHSAEKAVFVEHVQAGNTSPLSPADLVKAFHKHRFLGAKKPACIFVGAVGDSSCPMGESDVLLRKFHTFLQSAAGDHRPLFLCGFLERLDEAVDLQPIFEALNASGRQVFIAVPHYYKIEKLEGTEYDASIHDESNL